MLHQSPFLYVALAVALATGCTAPTIESGGYVAADGRAFANAPLYPGQARGTGVSLAAEPEFTSKSASGVHTVTLRPFYRADPNDERRTHADLREASYKVALDHFELAAGVGQFTWGALESYRPTDVMNQTDFVEAIDGSAKLGQPYAEAGWVGDSASVRLYYLPYFRERTFPGVRGRLRFPALIDTDAPRFASPFTQWQPSGAARFSLTAGDFDFGMGIFTGLSREPRFVAELTTGQVTPRYDLMHQASTDAQWTTGALSLKAEGFVRALPAEHHIFGGGGVGADYTFFKVAGDADVSLAAEYLFDTRGPSAPITLYEHDAFAGVRVAVNDVASTEVLGGGIVDVTDGATFARLFASRRLGDHWRVTVGANIFLGPPGQRASSFRKDDYGQARLAYYF